jgi:hypothetical protein
LPTKPNGQITDVVLVFACLKQNLLSMPIGNKAGYDIFFVVLYWTNRMSPTKILQFTIEQLKQSVSSLDRRLEETEQYSRRTCL